MKEETNINLKNSPDEFCPVDLQVINPPRILVACEESAILREEFTKLGADAWSCDILPSAIPGKHLQCDVMEIVNDNWDAMIAFPPCTYLAVTANRSFVNNPKRWDKRLQAMKFVYDLLNAPIELIALENPVGAISSWIRKPDQYVQPYEHGHKMSKKTGLWLKGLPLLKPTEIVVPEWIIDKTSGERYSPLHYKTSSTNNPEIAKLRSRTFKGIAVAMAEQWMPVICNKGL